MNCKCGTECLWGNRAAFFAPPTRFCHPEFGCDCQDELGGLSLLLDEKNAKIAQLSAYLDELRLWLADALSRNQIVHPIDRNKARQFLGG